MQPETTKLETFLTGFYLSKQAEGCSPNTPIEYRKDFAHFTCWCASQQQSDPTRITTRDLKAFLAWLRTQPNGHGKSLSPKTVYNAWVALRSFYRWLAEETGSQNPMLPVPAPKVQPGVIEPLSREQIAAILKACETTTAANTKGRASFAMRRDQAHRDKAIVLVLLDTGLRASELCAVSLGEVDLGTGRILVRCGKGGKGRMVYAGKAARRVL